jgi:AcrR family transcriptional regulator
MVADVNPPSPALARRRAKVVENRVRMIRAAADLFAAAGFAGTTMEAVAAASGMSVQSVYFSFHTKANLLQAAFDQAALGEFEATPPPLTDWYRAAVAEADADEALSGFMAGNCAILALTAPLTLAAAAAATSDAAVADVHERNENLRLQVLADVTTHLAAKRPLRDGVSMTRAVDIVFALVSAQLYVLLTSRGWTPADYESWATGVIRRELWG